MKLDKLSDGAAAGSVLGVVGVTVIICVLFLIRRLVMEDWTLRWYHIFLGPALWFKGPVPPVPVNVKVQVVQDYYRGHITKDDLQAGVSLDEQYRAALAQSTDVERVAPHLVTEKTTTTSKDELHTTLEQQSENAALETVDKPERFYKGPMAFWLFLKWTVLFGLFVSVVEEQTRTTGTALQKMLAKNVRDVHAYAHKYDNKTEYPYSMLQAFTATTASFAHGVYSSCSSSVA